MNDNRTTLVIREILTRILESERFASSPKMSAFLRYVVEEAVAGNAHRINAYSVAVDALDKPDSFDAHKDPCVRVLAMRLRESLADYYRANEEAVVITIPRGSYKPEFAFSTLALQNVDTRFDGAALASGIDSTLITGADDRAGERAVGPSSERHQPDDISVRPGSSASLSAALRSAPGVFNRLQSRQWLGIFLVLALGIWVVLDSRRAPSSDDPSQASVDQLFQDAELAAAEHSESSNTVVASIRSRPDLPTVHILRASPDSDERIRQMGTVVSNALAKFSNIVVIRDHVVIQQKYAWPEDYEIRRNAVNANNKIRLSAELIHTASGTIVHSNSFEMAQDGDELFTPRLIDKLDPFS